jgi:hypothetical protein
LGFSDEQVCQHRAVRRVHRGTPWQTVYFKSSAEPMGDWQKWSGGLFPQISHPTNDWLLADIFTTALNDNAARGLLSVNQTNLAAWSAVLSAVTRCFQQHSRRFDLPRQHPRYSTNLLEPSSPQLYKIVDSIMQARHAIRTAGLTPRVTCCRRRR